MKETTEVRRKSEKTPSERRRYPVGVDPRKERRRERAQARLKAKEVADAVSTDHPETS